jgi:hypothetical protein
VVVTKPPKSSVRPHLFVVDPDTPGCCLNCRLVGEPGDPRHTLPTVPEQAVVAGRYEHEDGGER